MPPLDEANTGLIRMESGFAIIGAGHINLSALQIVNIQINTAASWQIDELAH